MSERRPVSNPRVPPLPHPVRYKCPGCGRATAATSKGLIVHGCFTDAGRRLCPGTYADPQILTVLHPAPHDAELAAARDADRVARVAEGGGL